MLPLVYPPAHPTGSLLLPLPPARHPAGVWNSYAVPNNNEQLWSSIWTEKSESGICTGLSPNEWMRRAVQLRDQYNPDVRSRRCGCAALPAEHGLPQAAVHTRAHVGCCCCCLPAAAADLPLTCASPAIFPRSWCSRMLALWRAQQPQQRLSWTHSALHTARTYTWSATQRKLPNAFGILQGQH